jgi:type I restriction enzyme S subunit
MRPTEKTKSLGRRDRDSLGIAAFNRVETNLLPEDHLLVRQGDIAYNMMRMWQSVLGRAQYDCLVSPAYIVLAPNPVIDSLFGEYLLSTETAVAKFKHLSYGVVDDRLRLYFRDIVRIQFAIPRDTDEQLAIASQLTTMDETIQRTKANVEKLRQQEHALMHGLLTGRERVKVDG